MAVVKPISGQDAGEACRLLEERYVDGDIFQRTLMQMPNEAAGLLRGLDTHSEAMSEVVRVLAADPSLFTAKMAEIKAELDTRPKYGDWCLADDKYWAVQVVAGAERGKTIPAHTPLTALKPISILEPGERYLCSTEILLERALDENSPFYAPWGRDLMWRMLNEGVPEHFSPWLTYVFVGDKDLQCSPTYPVMLALYGQKKPRWKVDGWEWGHIGLNHEPWDSHYRLLSL